MISNWRRYNPYLRYPAVALGVTLLLLVPVAAQWLRFQVSSETGVLLEGDQRNQASYERVKGILGDEVVVAVNLRCDDVFSSRGIDAVRRVSEAFESQPGLLDVKSLTHSVRPVRRGLTLEMVPMVSANPDEAELERLRRFALENPLVRNVMVSPDTRETILLNTYDRDLSDASKQAEFAAEIETILEPFRAEGFGFDVLGFPLIEHELRETLRRDVGRFVPAAVAVLLIILGVTFRSVGIMTLVLLNQLAVMALLPGMIRLLGFELHVFSIMLFPLLAGIHLALLVHLFGAWQAAHALGGDADQTMDAALKEVLKPSAFAALTTAIGLGSLTFSEIAPVREFGQLGAAGIGLVFFMSFGPGLALIALISGRWPRILGRAGQMRTRGQFGAALEGWVRRRRRWILGTAGVAGLLSLAGLTQTQTDVRAVDFLNPRSPTREAVERVDASYGGVNVVQIEVDSGRTNGVNRAEFLRYLDELQSYASAQPEVTAVYSYAQLLAMLNQIWEGDRPDSFRLPTNPILLGTFTLALRTYPLPFLATLMDTHSQTAYLIVRSRDMPADRYLEMLARILARANSMRPPEVTVSAAQGIHSVLEADRRILRSQLKSAGVTLVLMGVVLALLWRSARLAAVSLFINVLPVAAVLAVAAVVGVSLNSVTIMVAAVCLGIAVDDSVHFITHWREERKGATAPGQALRGTLEAKARPILCSSLVLIGVFLIFGLSSFPPVVDFGWMAAGSFMGALMSVLVGLPAILSGVERGRGADSTDRLMGR
jgi:uncharacterized protein